MNKAWGVIAAVICSSACVAAGNGHLHYLSMRHIPQPTVERFTHCFNYGCDQRVALALPPETIEELTALFTPASTDRAQERERIRRAIALFEQEVGPLAGTQHDIRGTFRLYQHDDVKGRQHDCIDESTNTTIYITLLAQLGHLRYYRPGFPTSRQPFLGGAPWWHQTAVIEDRTTGEKFAVDSWFKDNGYPPYIVPYTAWKDGWMPPAAGKV